MARTAMEHRRRVGRVLEAPERAHGVQRTRPAGPEGRTRVERIFVNGDGQPEYVRVTKGRHVQKSILLPVQFVSLDPERRTLTLG